MRILTVLGTRPEIIRLSRVIELLDQHAEHVFIHTGQNRHARLSDLFFQELGVREPDVHLGVEASGFGAQAGQILARIEPVLERTQPDRVLILGDTNSGLTALVARRLGIPVYHMEAGNRCLDDRVPEEINRRVIDHASSVLLPYTNRSRENLLGEGIPGHRILVTGNPIGEVIQRFAPQIDASPVLRELGLEEGRYFLATIHRAENVDHERRLRSLAEALSVLARKYGVPVIGSLHPRTENRAAAAGVNLTGAGLQFLPPLGFFDFLRLERSAFCVLTDSGTVQEEACLLGVPNVTVRETTERPETLECGSNLLAGTDPEAILRAVELVSAQRGEWAPPEEYLRSGVAETVCRIVLGHRIPDEGERERRERLRARRLECASVS